MGQKWPIVGVLGMSIYPGVLVLKERSHRSSHLSWTELKWTADPVRFSLVYSEIPRVEPMLKIVNRNSLIESDSRFVVGASRESVRVAEPRNRMPLKNRRTSKKTGTVGRADRVAADRHLIETDVNNTGRVKVTWQTDVQTEAIKTLRWRLTDANVLSSNTPLPPPRVAAG